MCEELQNGSLPLLMATPNGRGDAGASRDAFLLNPIANTTLHLNCFRFLGKLICILQYCSNHVLYYCLSSNNFRNSVFPILFLQITI